MFTSDQPKPGFGKITAGFQQVEQVNKDYGRIEERCIRISAILNDYLDWPGVGQVYRLERCFIRIRRGQVIKTNHEMEYGIISLSRKKTSARRVMLIRQKHWLIETGLYDRRDMTFGKDATRMTQGTAGQIMACINNLVMALTKQTGFKNTGQARRWFDGHINQAFALLIA